VGDSILHEETIRPARIAAPPPRDPSWKRGRWPILLPIIVLIASVGWWIAARLQLARGISRQDEHALQAASTLFSGRIADMHQHLERDVKLLAQDPRIRTTLDLSHDEETLADLLGDINKVLGADLVALIDPDPRAAKVLASINGKAWSRVDLGSSQVITKALSGKTASDVWGFGDRLLAVSATRIEIRDQTAAVLVIGGSISEKMLDAVYALSGTGGALIIQDQLIALAPKDLRAAFQAGLPLAPGSETTIPFGPHALRARMEAVADKALPARVLWLRTVEKERADYEGLIAILWIPMIGATVLGALVAWRSAKRSGAQMVAI
jgi:hypothetical protein